MVGQDRIIGRLSRTDFRKFLLSVAMFVIAEALGLLGAFGIIRISLSPIALVFTFPAGFNIENWLYVIVHSPKEDEEIETNTEYVIAYIVPPLAAIGGEVSWWLLLISIITFVLLLARIVRIVMRREGAAETTSGS